MLYQRLQQLDWGLLPHGLREQLCATSLDHRGELSVAVSSAAVAHYLKMNEASILKSFNTQGKIERLKIQVRPGLFTLSSPKPKRQLPAQGSAAAASVQRGANDIKDESLKQSLVALAKRLQQH